MAKTIQEFLEKAKKLRAQAHAAEARFLLYIREFETNHEAVWKKGGSTVFETFLQSSQLVNVARYRAFCAGCALSDSEESVIMRGADATIELGKFREPTPEKVARFDEFARSFGAVHDDQASEQTSRGWRKTIEGPAPRVVQTASKLGQLEAENQALRAENRELKRKLAAAEKELAKLKKPAKRAAA